MTPHFVQKYQVCTEVKCLEYFLTPRTGSKMHFGGKIGQYATKIDEKTLKTKTK